MKKVIWIFGESATCKKTFIERMLKNENNMRAQFGLENEKIAVVQSTIAPFNVSFCKLETRDTRKEEILDSIDKFMQSSDTLLLLKGQTKDRREQYGNVLKEFALLYLM